MPLIVAVSGGSKSPFLFTAAWNMGGAAVFAIYFRRVSPHFFSAQSLRNCIPEKTSFWRNLGQHTTGTDPRRWNWQIWLSVVGSSSTIFYVWSFSYLPEVVIAIMSETWPVFSALFLQALFSQNTKTEMNGKTTALFLLSLVGAGLVVLSVSNSDGTAFLPPAETLFGLLLLFAAVCPSVFRLVQMKWLEGVQSFTGGMATREKVRLQMTFSMWGCAVASLVGLVGYVFVPGSFSATNFAAVFVLGGGIQFLGMLWEESGIINSRYNPRLQVIRYFTPAFGVFFLWIGSHSGGVDWRIFAAGLGMVIAGNAAVGLRNQKNALLPALSGGRD